ncbi:MAG: hypothetical protein HC857_14495 [Synechococcales cyanobacterium RU_4_20]|nr:hypothetical protein [Synechococcales cyanobacterium RU_4_20]
MSLLHLSLAILRLAQAKGQLADWFLLGFGVLALGFLSISSFMREVFVSPSTDIPILMLTGLLGWVLVILFQSQGAITGAITKSPEVFDPETFWDDRAILLLLGAWCAVD